MTSLPDLLQQGSAHAWLFVPTAILLGALHGLEPGHSKTMMAAFIIAVRGTVSQAVLLGVSAAASHTAVVWLVALGGQYLGQGINAEATEPYFQLASACIIVLIALWMFWRTRREVAMEQAGHHHDHGHDHDHHHDHNHGAAHDHVHDHGHDHHHGHAHAHARHDHHHHDGHHAHHDHDHGHGHDHGHTHPQGVVLAADGEYMDAHARAHADDIARRFANRKVTTGQIMLFGLTGGLIPCPAAITVLLICLQLKQLSLGVVLVLCFSIGLAVTMVSAGVIASLSMRHIQKRWSGFSALARRAPYASVALMLLIALYMAWSGYAGLAAHAA